MRAEEITLQSITVEPEQAHRDASAYDTVTFRIFPDGHPNSFTVPISVNTSQYAPDQIERQARFVLHRMMRALADATAGWDGSDPSRS